MSSSDKNTPTLSSILRKVLLIDVVHAYDRAISEAGDADSHNVKMLSLHGSAALFMQLPDFNRVPSDIDICLTTCIDDDPVEIGASRQWLNAIGEKMGDSIDAFFSANTMDSSRPCIHKIFSLDQMRSIINAAEYYRLSAEEVALLRSASGPADSILGIEFLPATKESIPSQPLNTDVGGLYVTDIRSVATYKLSAGLVPSRVKDIADVAFLFASQHIHPDDPLWEACLADCLAKLSRSKEVSFNLDVCEPAKHHIFGRWQECFGMDLHKYGVDRNTLDIIYDFLEQSCGIEKRPGQGDKTQYILGTKPSFAAKLEAIKAAPGQLCNAATLQPSLRTEAMYSLGNGGPGTS